MSLMSVWTAVKPPAILTILGNVVGPFVFGLVFAEVYALAIGRAEFDPYHFALLGLPPLLAIDVVAAIWAGYRIVAQGVGGMTASALGGLVMGVLGNTVILPLHLALYGSDSLAGYVTGSAASCVASLVLGAVGGYFAQPTPRRELG